VRKVFLDRREQWAGIRDKKECSYSFIMNKGGEGGDLSGLDLGKVRDFPLKIRLVGWK
jgi:hypothetical protein